MTSVCICLSRSRTLTSNLDTANKVIGHSPPCLYVKPDTMSFCNTLANLEVRWDEGKVQLGNKNDFVITRFSRYGMHTKRLMLCSMPDLRTS
jgi:hypothetical protein